MNNQFIRIISPFSVAIALLFDAGAAFLMVTGIQKVQWQATPLHLLFLLIALGSVFLAFFYTREVLRHGILLKKKSLEITSLDENNEFAYCQIEHFEITRDTKASFRKNFVDRYSHLILYLKDQSIVTIDLGLTTGKTLTHIETALQEKITDNL